MSRGAGVNGNVRNRGSSDVACEIFPLDEYRFSCETDPHLHGILTMSSVVARDSFLTNHVRHRSASLDNISHHFPRRENGSKPTDNQPANGEWTCMLGNLGAKQCHK